MASKKNQGKTYEHGAFFKYQDLYKRLLDIMTILPSDRIGDKGVYIQNYNESHIINQDVIIKLREQKNKIVKNIGNLIESLSNYHSNQLGKSNDINKKNKSYSYNKYRTNQNLSKNNPIKLSLKIPKTSRGVTFKTLGKSQFDSIKKIKRKKNLKINSLRKINKKINVKNNNFRFISTDIQTLDQNRVNTFKNANKLFGHSYEDRKFPNINKVYSRNTNSIKDIKILKYINNTCFTNSYKKINQMNFVHTNYFLTKDNDNRKKNIKFLKYIKGENSKGLSAKKYFINFLPSKKMEEE